jgi:hypothetical protein
MTDSAVDVVWRPVSVDKLYESVSDPAARRDRLLWID